MLILRPTRKLQRSLPVSADVDAESDTALGDWYVNRIVVDRKPLLLLLSAKSLLPILTPAREVRSLPDRLPELVSGRLESLGVSSSVIEQEVSAMSPIAIAPTVNRSVLGIMVDFAKLIPHYVDRIGWHPETLSVLEAQLEDNPCHAGSRNTVFPNQKAPDLLTQRWLVH